MTVPERPRSAAGSVGWAHWLPAAAGLLTVVLYAPGSGRSLDFDSSQTVGAYVRTPSMLDAVSSQRLFNNHPAFSLTEHVVYSVTGSSEEWVLRVAPILFAGLAVAFLVWALQRHLGSLPAACAGLLVATNPTVSELSRSVRGYSLLVLCGITSSIAFAQLLSPTGTSGGRRWSWSYVVAVAIGTATHLYMVPIVLGQIVVVVARKAYDERWGLRWLAGLGLGASIYAAMVGDLVDAAREGSRTFKPEFPLRLGEVVVGSGLAAALVGLVVILGAGWTLRERRDLAWAGAVVGAAVAATWLVTASVHLEARFHVWLVPAAAAAAAVAVQRQPRLAAVVLIGAALNLLSTLDGYLDDPNVQPELAAVLEQVAADGGRGCVTSFSVLPILGYTSSFESVVEPSDLADCDVVAVPFPNLDGELAAAAREEMAVEAAYEAWFEDGVVFARDPSFFEELCQVADPDLCPP